jgi:hypothetical protein
MGTLMPLNVQTTYKPGEEIDVTISMYGIDGGGHFEFHACPLTYPEKPTEECFNAHPLTFVSDAYYGALPDEKYPERAYVPLVGAFENGESVVVDHKENPAGAQQMMEFKYRLRLPKDEELVTRLDGEVGEALVSNSEEIAPQQHQAGSMAQAFSAANQGKRRRHQQAIHTPIETDPQARTGQEQPQEQPQLQLEDAGPGPAGTWYATQKDDEYTISAVETVPISSVVTDGKGTTTITTLEGVTVIGGGPKVPASTTINWGDKLIYGDGIELDATTAPVPPLPTLAAATINNPQVVSAEVPLNKPSNINPHYVLLRWHYQTARECYPKGYESYSWPSEWGTWSEPWSGECIEESPWEQDHYWNCAEIQIVSGAAPATMVPPASPASAGDSAFEFMSEEIATTNINVEGVNDAPDAAPDMILVGVNELAHLHVLANDIDPDGDDLRISEVEKAQHGYAAVLDGGKEIIYAPDTDFVGLDCEFLVLVSYLLLIIDAYIKFDCVTLQHLNTQSATNLACVILPTLM